VEYWLTPVGRSLLEPFGHLVAWANNNRAAIVEARTSFDTTVAA
jgi:DNA-binding HxlR family transcriptional regulator